MKDEKETKLCCDTILFPGKLREMKGTELYVVMQISFLDETTMTVMLRDVVKKQKQTYIRIF